MISEERIRAEVDRLEKMQNSYRTPDAGTSSYMATLVSVGILKWVLGDYE